MKIRAKLTVLAGLAILIPLLSGIVYVRTVGRQHFEQQVGVLYLTIANEMAENLGQDVVGHMSLLSHWVDESDFVRLLQSQPNDALDMEAVDRIEAGWPSLSDSDPLIQSILRNPVSDRLNVLQHIDPVFAELMVTDRCGRLIASSNRTTDYWQADELWWQQAGSQGQSRLEWPKKIRYDASAGVEAIDVTVPIRSENGEILGVIKGSLNAVQLLNGLAPDPWNAEIIRDIYYADGSLFTRLNTAVNAGDPGVHASTVALDQLSQSSENWQISELFPRTNTLAACVPLAWNGEGGSGAVSNAQIHVVVHRPYNEAIAPIQSVINTLTVRGVQIVAVFAIASFLMATFWFVRPLRKLHRAALAISEHIKMREQGRDDDVRESLQHVSSTLKELHAIRSHDEMQELSGIFSHMGKRILNFHRQLERELASKTEEINEDLAMAREFQEALLPDAYPCVSYPHEGVLYNMGFSHVYRPAQSVGGDFFDVMETPHRCIRVLVADVMGHGARSALLTAILHSLVYGCAADEDDPAHLLKQMNEEFYKIGKRTGDVIFVTAAHMIFDVVHGVVRYAVAGHPSPLVMDHTTGEVSLLVSEDYQSPAAGLLEEAEYCSFERSLEKEQTFLLYTDGAVEAMNVQQNEFGLDQLLHSMAGWNKALGRGSLPDYLIELLNAHMDTVPASDDICLLAVEISKAQSA